MINKKLKVGKVPNLRFPGFEGEWKQITLGECSISLDYGMNAAAKSFDGINRYIRITDIDEKSSRYKSENPVSPSGNIDEKYIVGENDILFARTGASTGKSYLYHYDDGKLYFAGFLIRAKIKNKHNSKFIFSQTQTEKYNKWVQLMSMRSGQPGINSQEYSSFKFFLSSTKQEQDKIATFLSLIDERILTQNKIIEVLKIQIQGFREHLFSKKLKFKDIDGNDFPDWENKNLGEICQKKSSNISANKIEDNYGEYIIYGASGVLKKVDFYEEENDYISIVKDGAGVGRLFYCKGKSSVLGTMDIIKSQNNTNSHFLFYLLSNIDFTKYVTGSTIPHIYFKDYKKENFEIPCLEEQTKIAKILLSIDSKIDAEIQILQKLEQQKKYLLQNLFV